MTIESWLKQVVEQKASDLFITVGVPPSLKVIGKIVPLAHKKLTKEEVEKILFSLMDEKQQEAFNKTKEANFAIQTENLGRFRVSVFQQRSHMGAVFRRIETKIPTVEELHLPNIIETLSLTQRGLIILVGATSTGKSTTLAAMIGYRNQNTKGHIVTIEDPIEFVHEHAGCIVTQRDVGVDTESFGAALKNTLRQAPDVILIGEIRDQETMQYAITFAETGHLCLATLHANNANQALDRIIHFFPQNMHSQIWLDLSFNLKAIVAQQLIPTIDGLNRVPAVEILINTPVMADHIRKGEVAVLKGFIQKATDLGMQTFDQALYQLYSEGKISYESALQYADSENEVRLMIKLHQGSGESTTLKDMNILKDSDDFQP